jgi:hypothetical protein
MAPELGFEFDEFARILYTTKLPSKGLANGDGKADSINSCPLDMARLPRLSVRVTPDTNTYGK